MEYFLHKAKRRIKVYNTLIVLGIIGIILILIKQVSDGVYEFNDAVKIAGVAIGVLLLYLITHKFGLWISSKGEAGVGVAIFLTMPIGLVLFWPMIQYYRGDAPGTYENRFDNKVFKRTIKAYQKAWHKQCFAKRVVLPIFYACLFIALAYLSIFVMDSYPKVASWVFGIGFVLIWIAVLAGIGGIQDVRVRRDYYDVSIGTGIFDYGDVKVQHRETKFKDETNVSIIGMILAFILTPAVIVVAVCLVILFILIQLIRIIIPSRGKRTIYLHKRKVAVHPDYVPCANNFLSFPVMIINKFLGAVLRINFVNESFWLEGIGPDYIRNHLSNRNLAYLEKKLDKIERKYGYRYHF